MQLEKHLPKANRLDQALQRWGGPLLGSAVYQYDPAFVEISGYLGYRALWFEMEHAPLDLAQIVDLCRIASGLGLLTMIRIPDSSRANVLRAAECGPDILDLPMGNSVAELKELVTHARFAPEGARGFFGASRALRYGAVGAIPDEQQRINRELCLLAQIETRQAVESAEELCAVEGIDGIFLGPGDLSASYGVPGQAGHPLVHEAMNRVISVAKRNGRHIAMFGNPREAAQWASAGVDLIYCTSDVACMRIGAQSVAEQFKASLAQGTK